MSVNQVFKVVLMVARWALFFRMDLKSGTWSVAASGLSTVASF